jgi:hypothetical protein
VNNELLSMLLSWVPLVAVLGVFIWFVRNTGMRARSRSGVAMIELYEQQVPALNVILERIASSMETLAGQVNVRHR